MTEPELPHNFTTSFVEAINDNRAALGACIVILVQKGVFTIEELNTMKAQIVTLQDRQKAEADEAYQKQMPPQTFAELLRRLFS